MAEPVSDVQRKEVIDECVRYLMQQSRIYVEMANEMSDEDRFSVYEMAHIYQMAAECLRELDADEVAKQQRNLAVIKKWREGGCKGIPKLESYGPQEH